MKIKQIQYKKRRGLSSIVGALIFVVLMVATFAVLGVALNSQTNIVETNREVADTELKKVQEDFGITVYTDPSQILTVDVENKGQNPVEIFSLVITNQTGPSATLGDFPTNVYDIPPETSLISSDDTENILETTSLKLALAQNPGETEIYHFKVISSLGTIETVNLSCDDTACGAVSSGGGSLSATLFLDGPNGINTKTSTVVMFVSNSYDVAIDDVQPTLGFSAPYCDDMWTVDTSGATEEDLFTEDIDPCVVSPSSAITLDPHATAIFKWDGTVHGDIGAEFTFCSNVSGTHPTDGAIVGNGGSNSCDTMTVINPNDCAGCGEGEGGGEGGETIIILEDLLIRPSIFLTLPSPYGSSASGANDNLGLWGIQIANPTNSSFAVSKVTITSFAPGANNNVLIFDGTANNENVSPGPLGGLGDWQLADENVMVWRNYTEPIELPPYSAETFMLKVKPATNGGRIMESVITQGSVFSTIGSFGKAGYQTTMYSAGGSDWSPIANVFMATAADSAASADIIGHKLNLTNGTAESFTVSLADMDEQDATYIKSGARLVINIPREWTYVSTDYTSKFIVNATQPEVIEHGDGSTQIIGITNENIGDVNSQEVASITFTATSPEKENERMYVMYLLGDGLTEDDYAVGPQSEAILHVIGNVTGYP